ncbi:MAG: hypothetical protein RI826_08885 [Chlorobium phaeovibrioides]|nr:hypothetical protein [Chlorobium phaeovibrioides]
MRNACSTELPVRDSHQPTLRTGAADCPARRRAPRAPSRAVATIQAQKVNTTDLLTVTRRIRFTEFQGTTYMPLPDEAAIVRIIREVQGESIIQRSNEPRKGYDPDPIDMSEYDGMTEDETWEAMFEKAYQKCGGR